MLSCSIPDITLPLIDETVMADWCSDLDPEDVEAILSQVPAQCGTCFQEIATAVSGGDLNKAKRVAHRLKGMAANLGAVRLARFARTIEIEAETAGGVEAQLPALSATLSETIAALNAWRQLQPVN